jgi:hypothetical protein
LDLAIATALISAGAGLAGVAVGGWLTALNQAKQRRQQRIREQLDEFYAPMLGLRLWILAKSEVRLKVSGAMDSEWRKLMAAREGNVAALQRLSDERFPDFKVIIEENNRQLVDEIMPTYHEMVELFRDKMALAEPSTIEHFGALIEFVELWDRWLDRTVPPEVVTALEHGEDKLLPFYEDVAAQFAKLRDELKE